MFNHPYLLVLAGGLVAALWQHLRSLGSKVAARFVDGTAVYDTDAPMAAALLVYLRRYPRTRLGKMIHRGGRTRIRPLKRVQLVAYEVTNGPVIYWVGGRPLYAEVSSDASSTSVHCSWVRGTVDFDALLLAATHHAHGLTSQDEDGPQLSRFTIMRVAGRPRGRDYDMQSGADPKAGQSVPDGRASRGPNEVSNAPGALHNALLRHSVRPVGWDLGDLVLGSALPGSAVDRLALSPAVLAAIADIKEWAGAREWYEDKDIPYRHGVLFYGGPGNGKTRTVAALGQDLNLPVLAFDLASLTNPEFLDAWGSRVRYSSPCIALFEDIDAVFEGRENIAGREDGLTFDCFLNALGGVEVADGVLVVITTNRPETLDPAIARVGGVASRPGRIEVAVELGPPDADGRRKIARRVLADCHDAVEAAVAAGAGESGAQFLDRCRVLALARRRRPSLLLTSEEAA